MTINTLIPAVVLALMGWFALSLGVMWWTSAAPAALVLFPSAVFIEQLDPDMRILNHDAVSITIASGRSDLADALYHIGALIVLPAGLTGCLPLPEAART